MVFQIKHELIVAGILFFVCTTACNQDDSGSGNTTIPFANSNGSSLNQKDTILQPVGPEVVALSFYNWYLKDIYLKQAVESPDIVLSKDSTYVLDASRHKAFLESGGYFSKQFYAQEASVFKACEDQLRLVSRKEVEASGAVNPAEFIDGNECAFTQYKFWTNGQGEPLNKAELVTHSIKADTAKVTIALSDSASGGVFSRPRVQLIKEGGAWKISRIVVID